MAIIGFISNIPSDRYLLRDKFAKMALLSEGYENKEEEDDENASSDEFLF